MTTKRTKLSNPFANCARCNAVLLTPKLYLTSVIPHVLTAEFALCKLCAQPFIDLIKETVLGCGGRFGKLVDESKTYTPTYACVKYVP